MLEVKEWAEIRRLHFVGGLSVRELARRTGRGRNTIRRALRSEDAPRYVRGPGRSMLDPFKDEIRRLVRDDPRLPGIRVLELIAEQGYGGGKTLVYDYLAEVRPFYLPRPRTFQRTVYRPGEILQFDLWEPRRELPVGYGQTRRGFVVVAALGYSRAGAGALVFSKEAPDILAGLWRCLGRLGALPGTLVCDREGSLHAGGGRPSGPFARFCGQLRVGWHICAPGDPQAKGLVERLIGFLETSFEPGRRSWSSSPTVEPGRSTAGARTPRPQRAAGPAPGALPRGSRPLARRVHGLAPHVRSCRDARHHPDQRLGSTGADDHRLSRSGRLDGDGDVA